MRALATVLLACGACATPERPALPIELEAVRAGRAHPAVEALERWLARHPDADVVDRVEVLRWAAHARTLMQEPDLALGHLESALALAPADAWLHYAHGTALHATWEYAAALESYGRALALNPSHIKALQHRGFTHEVLGDRDAALADYEQALVRIDAASDAALAAWGGDRERERAWTTQARDALLR